MNSVLLDAWLQMLLQGQPLRLLPHFHRADRQPEAGFHDMNRLAGGQRGYVIGDLVFPALGNGQADSEDGSRKDVSAGISKARTFEIGFF